MVCKLDRNKYNGGACTQYSAVCIRYLRVHQFPETSHANYFSCCRSVDIAIRAGDGNLHMADYEKGKDQRTKGSAWSLGIRDGCDF